MVKKTGRNQIKMHLCVKCYSPSALARLSLMRNLDVNISIASSKVVQDKVTSKILSYPSNKIGSVVKYSFSYKIRYVLKNG